MKSASAVDRKRAKHIDQMMTALHRRRREHRDVEQGAGQRRNLIGHAYQTTRSASTA